MESGYSEGTIYSFHCGDCRCTVPLASDFLDWLPTNAMGIFRVLHKIDKTIHRTVASHAVTDA